MYYPCEECFRQHNKEYTSDCNLTCDYAKVVQQKKKILHKMALQISKMCVGDGCPLSDNCEVLSDEACVEKITNWIEEVIE